MTLPHQSQQQEDSSMLSSSDAGPTISTKKQKQDPTHLENSDLLIVSQNGLHDGKESHAFAGVPTFNNGTISPSSTNGLNSSFTEETVTSNTPSTSPLIVETKTNTSLSFQEPATTSTVAMPTKTATALDQASSLTNENQSITMNPELSISNGTNSTTSHSKELEEVSSSVNNLSLAANALQMDAATEATDDALQNLNLNTPPGSPKSKYHRFHLLHQEFQKDASHADDGLAHPDNDCSPKQDIPGSSDGQAPETFQPAPPSPELQHNQDKGKGKRKSQFFNSNIFRAAQSRPSSPANVDPTIDDSVDPGVANGSSTLKKSTKHGEQESQSKRTSHHLHKSRSKSDVGLYDGPDLQTIRLRLRSRSRHSDEHDPRKLEPAEPSDNLPESHSDTELDHIKNDPSPTATSPRTEFKRRRTFLPRYATFSTAGASVSTGSGVAHAGRHHNNMQRQPSDAENPESEVAGEHPQRFSRRHTLFSMDYNPPSMAIDWKDVRNALRRFKKKKQEERTEDQVPEDDTALISELASGTPSAMIIPMSFLKDDRGIPRIPVLLHHVKASVNDITLKPNEKNRKYSIELSYGSGSTSLNWSIVREYRDLIAMHSRLKVLSFQNVFSTKLQLPKFPSRHHVADQMIKERYQQERLARHGRTASLITPIHSNPTSAAQTPGSAPVASSSHATTPNHAPNSAPVAPSVHPHPHTHPHHHTHSQYLSTIADEQRSRHSISSDRSGSILSLGSNASENSRNIFRRIHRTASIASNLHAVHRPSFIGGHGNAQENEEERDAFIERLRSSVEKYILDLLREMRFRPEANRVFQFLELSNMSIRLAPENSYHGKEGYLILRTSAASMGWRVSHWKPNELSLMIDRHTSRWYLVRESYIVCVNDISSANVSEVFLVDPDFNVTFGSSATIAPPPQEKEETTDKSHQGFTFQVENGERKMKLVATSQRQLSLWVDSINHMKEGTVWSKPHRFHSFAPVRQNVQARWFVDAVSYFII